MLYIRILYPNDFGLLNKIKQFESDIVNISIAYNNEGIAELIEYDIHEYHTGLIMSSVSAFEADGLKNKLHDLKKLVFQLFDYVL